MKTKINEILRVSQINHNALVKKLNSSSGNRLIGKWVAVTKNQFFVDNNSKKVLTRAKKIEPKREKVLLVKVPNKNILSLRF